VCKILIHRIISGNFKNRGCAAAYPDTNAAPPLAFIQSIIEPKLIRDIHAKIKNILYNHLNLHHLDAARKMIQQILFDGLCKMLYPTGNDPSFVPQKGKTNVVMFLGAQGLLLLPVMVLNLFVHLFLDDRKSLELSSTQTPDTT